jgi:o-succinylbenzoate synthase
LRILRARLAPLRLRLRRPLVTAFGVVGERRGVRLFLEDDAGRTGVGECVPLPELGTEELGTARGALEAMAARLAGARLEDLDEIVFGGAALGGTPTALAALDAALHDLRAQAEGLSVAGWLAARGAVCARDLVPASALLVEESPQALLGEARRAVALGFGALKLKVGARDAARDEARVAAVRTGAGPEAEIRVDANGAFARDEALRRLEGFARHGVAFAEQPVAAGDVAGLAFVRARSPLPVAADEAVLRAGDLERVLAAGAADLVVLKPAALGGIARTSRLAERARDAGVGVVVTSLLDGAVGLHAALHLAAVLPDPLRACGLATGELLAGDPLAPPRLEGGWLLVPRVPGLGVVAAGVAEDAA